jgi:type III restriction enzyme
MLQRVMPELMGMKNILVLNDEAHHCYREKPRMPPARRPEGRREEGGRRRTTRPPASGSPARGRQAQARPSRVYRPLRHAVLPARLRLCRGHAVPLDHERLLADGRHRVRHRQAAARARGRQHPGQRHAHVPQPLGAHPQGHAEEGRAARRDLDPLKPARRAADRARGALRPLREDLRALEEGGHRRAAGASSSSATTPRPRSWSTTTSPASTARTTTAATLENGRLPLFRNFDEHGNPLARARTPS